MSGIIGKSGTVVQHVVAEQTHAGSEPGMAPRRACGRASANKYRHPRKRTGLA